MYEDVKIKESLLDSDGITFKPVLGSAYILELDGLVEYQMSQNYSEVVFGYWGRAEDPETGLTNLCIYPPKGNYYENNPECVGYYRGRVTYDGEEYDSWYWDNWTNTIIYTDIITYIEVKVNPFFDFMKYCPRLDALLRPVIIKNHFLDTLGFLTGTYPATTSSSNMISETVTGQTSSGPATAYNNITINGSKFFIQYMANSNSNVNYTYIRSYNIYTPDTSSYPVLLSPCYRAYLNNTYSNCCNPDVSFSYIYPNSFNGNSNYPFLSNTSIKEFYLPEFYIDTENFNKCEFTKVHGPYSVKLLHNSNYTYSNNESVLIIWEKKPNNGRIYIKPKYLCFYTYGGGNIPSNCGGSMYSYRLEKIIEIE